MEIFELLKKDHETIKTMLENLINSSKRAAKSRESSLKKLFHELEVHIAFEEKMYYPIISKEGSTKNPMLDAYEEHHVVKLLIRELKKLSPISESWKAKLTVLKNNLEHHIQQEEDLFDTVQKLVDEEALEKMALQLKECKSIARKKIRLKISPEARAA